MQNINASIAGAFAGGVAMEKEKQENANKGNSANSNGAQSMGNFGGWIDKLSALVGKDSKLQETANANETASENATGSTVTNQTDVADDAMKKTNSITVTEEEVVRDPKTGAPKKDENGNVITKNVEKTYTPDENGVYRDEEGGALYEKDADGKWVEKTVDSNNSSDLSTNLANTDGSLTGDNKTATTTTSTDNFSLAAAGAVNVNTNNTTTDAKVLNSEITVGDSLEVTSNQKNQIYNIAGGGAKAGSVGAGAAVNVNYDGTSTKAIVEDTKISGGDAYNLNVLADEYNKIINVAAGLGAATDNSSTSGTKLAVGGSFNVNVIDNDVIGKISNSTINDANGVSVVGNNYTDLYNGAGGLGVTSGGSSGIGAGIASNTNVLVKSTGAEISDSKISANNLSVIANNKGENTEDLVSFAVGGAVVSGSSSGYTFTGALGTDVLNNTVSAAITSGSVILTNGDVNVGANSDIHDANVNGSLSFSSASSGFGAGLGTIVSVIDNDINSSITNSTISKSGSVNVNADSDESLEFLAVNMGIQTGGGSTVNVNGIVNVLSSTIGASVDNSVVNSTGAINVVSDYDNLNHGLTLVGAGSSSGVAVGGNVLVNVYDNDINAVVTDGSTLSAGTDVKVRANSDETLDINAAAVTASASGTAAVAADIAANIITNTTGAKLLGDVLNSSSVLVEAGDISTFTQRSMTVAGTGGTAGVGGSVTVDVIAKNIEALTGRGSITSSGNVKVSANSENSFGGTKGADGNYIVADIGSVDQIMSQIGDDGLASSFANWQMTVDAAGGSTAGVSGSLITKVLNSHVNAEVQGTTINADSLDVMANDYTVVNAIVGNITGGGTAAVGGSAFVNVVKGATTASIANGSVISTTGDINVNAQNREDIRSIIVVGGGAGSVAVNGAASVNVISDNTISKIDGGVSINNAKDINVNVKKTTDIQSVDLAANGAGAAAVGGILKSNTFVNTTTAQIGGNDNSIINATGSVNVNSYSDEAFSAMIAAVGGAGTAAVTGVGVVNIISSDVNALVNNANITSGNEINVSATHGYNKASENKTAALLNFLKDNGDNDISISQIEQLSPLVSVLSIAGAGSAAATGSIIVNTVTSDVNASVINSVISSNNGLIIEAEQNITTYDAMAGIAGSGFASVAANGNVNILEGSTTASLSGSEVTKGGVTLDSLAKTNINSIGFAASFSGTGASAAVGVNSNVISNSVNSYIENSNIVGNTNVKTRNNIDLNNVYVAAVANGVGASVAVAPMVNSFVGSSNAYITGSTLDNGTNSIGAYTNINTGSLMVGGTGNGVGAAVSGFVITNNLINDTNAYISDTEINNAVSTSVYAATKADMYELMASLAGNGVGAAITYNGIVNIFDNNTNVYIENSSISGGIISVNADTTANVETISGSASGNGIGDATAVNSLVNVFTNNTDAHILSTEITNAGAITVKAVSGEDLNNTDIGFTASGTAAVSANALVNVIENVTSAYIDTKDKNITSSGKLSVEGKDTIAIQNTSGVLAASGVAAAGASVVVNVLNNEVKSQILGTTGAITANSVNVAADSVIGMTNLSNSAAVGLAGIAGNVVVNSIGSGIGAVGESDLESQKNTAINSANSSVKKLGKTVSTTNKQKGGVIAEINADITSTGNVDVKASNNDTFTTTNASTAGGAAAGTVGILVNDMKYKTTSSISGGSITSNNGSVSVKSSNTIKADTNAAAASVGGIAVNGNAAYFRNNAETNAYISNASVSAKNNINIDTSSSNKITSNSIAGTAGIGTTNLNVAIAEDNSKVNAKITGNNVNISADTLNINTTIGSALSTELLAASISGATLNVVVNKATSNVVSNAIIDATGTIQANNLNILAKNSGIDVDNTFYAGTLAIYNANTSYQGSFVNSDFKAGINNSNITISGKDNDFAKSINIRSGVSSSNTNSAGTITANVNAKSAQSSFASASVTSENAVINANSTVTVNAKSLKTNSLTAMSKMSKQATTGSSSSSLGAVSLQTLLMNSKITGSNTINIQGNNEIQGNAVIDLADNSDTLTRLISGNISLVGSSVNKLDSIIDTDTNVNIGGNLSVGKMSVNSNVNRDTYNSADALSGGLVQVGTLKVTTQTLGDSLVNISAKAQDTNYKNELIINASAENTAESILSETNVTLVGLSRDTSSNTLNTTNKITMSGADIHSTGDVTLNASSTNRATMRKKANVVGVAVASGSKLQNNINSSSDVTVNNSTIHAKNVNLSSSAKLGNVNDQSVDYNIKTGGGLASNDTTLTNTVEQESDINIKNSNITATNNMTAAVNTSSTFKQSISTDGSGFSVHANATSNLNVHNINNFNNDANSVINAAKFNLALDSTNDLSSGVSLDVGHFGGRDAEGYSNLNLAIDNTVNNNGTISTGSLAQIDFMKNSTNKLNQTVSVVVKAAIATGETGGGINYTVNNALNVPSNALISSGKDVIVNYTDGSNILNSKIYSKKTSYALFGIPIVKKKTYSSVTKNINNSLALDGEIRAGHNAQRSMTIDKDGTITNIEGFIENEYKVVDAVTIDSETLTQETINSLNSELELLNAKLTELQNTKDSNDADIAVYESQIAEINKILAEVNDKETILTTDVQTTMKDNIQGTVVGSGDNQISQEIFDKIYDYYNEDAYTSDKSSLSDYLNTIIVKEAYTDDDGNNIPAQYLSEAQKTNILDSFNSENGKMVENDYFSTYDGKIIVESADSISEIQTSLNTYLDTLTNDKATLAEYNTGISNSINEYNENITSITDQIAYLEDNPLSGVDIDRASIQFENLKVLPSKIELNGLERNEVTGSGKFRTYSPSLTVENYSNRDLVFKNIDLGSASDTGLIFNNKNFGYLANTDEAVNDNVFYITDEGSSEKAGDITINNYFDHNNPTLDTSNATASDITMGGLIKTSGDLTIWNESGDITFGNSITSQTKDIVATQGDMVYNNAKTGLTLNNGDRIFAGKNVKITAKSLVNNGTITAGYADRSLTITNSMLNNLIIDPTTGEKNMINLGGSDYSPYLNETNNIKALYIDGKIVLFNTTQEGGNVDLNGNVSGNGTVVYTNGYAKVDIKNNTDKELVVNNLANNYMGGTLDNKGSLTAIKQGYDKANTTITSNNSTVDVKGLVENEEGLLAINAKNIVVENRLTSTGVQDYVIDVTGDMSLTSTAGTSVSGKIINHNGETQITNTTSGDIVLEETANIISNGKTTIENKGSGLIETIKGSLLTQNADTLNLISANGIELNGKIVNNNAVVNITNNNDDLLLGTDSVIESKGNVNITNKGNGALLAAGLIDNTGNVSVTNNGDKGSVISGAVKNTGNTTITNTAGNSEISGSIINIGNTTIDNSGNGASIVSGTINNKNGDTKLVNSGEKGLEISGTISSDNGNVDIENSQGTLILTDTGVITNNKNIKVTNNSNGLFSIFGSVFNKNGKTEIANTNADSGIELGVTLSQDFEYIASRGKITNENGELRILNNGSKGLNILGDIVSSGSADIENTNGGLYVATIITNNTVNKGTITSSGDLTMKNSGSEGINIFGDVTNSVGKLTISNDNAGIVIGRTYIDENTFVQGKVENTLSGNGDSLVIENTGTDGILVEGIIENTNGNLSIQNNNTENSSIVTTENSLILNNKGTINVSNKGSNGISLGGVVENKSGVTNISNNNSVAGITVETSALLNNIDGNMNINNIGSSGILIEGLVNVENQDINITNENSNLVIGELNSDNDFYVNADKGNIVITQTNGNILNGIVDIDDENSNHDLGNHDHAYKTLLASGGNLIMNVVDGDIGVSNLDRPGFSVNGDTRDYTESVNVNIQGVIDINVNNADKSDDRLVNLRAKDSDMNIQNITADGNIILTAADWKQADENPAPDNENYYKGYSILNARNDGGANLTGQDISVIASDKIGTSDNKFVYNQDTAGDKNSAVSFEAEGDINLTGLSNSSNRTNIYQLISKQGSLDFDLNSDAVIKEVTAADNLHILQKDKSLTIYDLGKVTTSDDFVDMLYPHDRIVLSDSVVPETIAIEVLDAITGGNDASSTLKIYNAYAKGKGEYDKNGKLLADVSLMADNIYANSSSAPNSVVNTVKNPNGYSQSETEYSNAAFSGDDTLLSASGFNSYGEGEMLSFDITGVSKEFVDNNVENPNRTNYIVQNEVNTIDYFQNPDTLLNGYDYRVDNLALSVNSNDITTENRGVNFNKLYVNDAYIDTKDLNLTIRDAYVNNYAEIRNGNREGSGNYDGDYRWTTVIDNDFRRIVNTKDIRPVTLQLYTAKTGSFSLVMGDDIILQTKAPSVYYNPDQLLNTFGNENSFYRLTHKDDKIQQTSIMYKDLKKKSQMPSKRISMRFDTTNDTELQSSIEILDISRTGALLKNDGSLKVGDIKPLYIKAGDIEANVDVKVVRTDFISAGVEFINMPEDTVNKIIYRYMQKEYLSQKIKYLSTFAK